MPRYIPKYFGFRMYFTSNVLYAFLVIPFLLFIIGQRIPEIAERKGFLSEDNRAMADSLNIDSLVNEVIATGQVSDSLLGEAVVAGLEKFDSTLVHEGPKVKVSGPGKTEDEEQLFNDWGALDTYFLLLFLLTLVSYIVGLIYNIKMRSYFIALRKRKEPPEKLHSYTKKHLMSSSLVNALIVASPGIIVLFYSLFIILGNQVDGALEKKTFLEFFYISILATLLEFLFVFYWQKHRVHIKYIDFVFSKEELRKRIRPHKGVRIRDRLLIASFMTTFLPLLIVFSYLLQSLTRIRNLELDELSQEAWEILMGPWGTMIGGNKEIVSLEKIQWMVYVNATDSFSMIVGIGAGIMVSLLYLLLFIRWTNQDLSYPLKELLTKMRNARGGKADQYTLVRTSDEIGELAEGYNEMTSKIQEHLSHISTLNRDLEKKVEERTQEVVNQKEEIEAQKEEIETQLDMVTSQRDTISKQNEQIIDSIKYAEKIQLALLPPGMHMKEVLREHFVLFKPRDIVSGDFYWTAFRDGKLLIAAADCTGHGVPGAFLSIMGISSLNEILNRSVGVPEASMMLENLRDYVIHSLHQTGTKGEANDGIEIALIIYDPSTGELEFAGANRPLYLVRKEGRGDGKSEIEHIKGDRMPIGIYDHERSPFTSQKMKTSKGDRLYLFSDGYTDQLGGPNRKTYRAIHFRKLLLDIKEKPMEEQEKILNAKHMEWRGETEQIDDILVIGMLL